MGYYTDMKAHSFSHMWNMITGAAGCQFEKVVLLRSLIVKLREVTKNHRKPSKNRAFHPWNAHPWFCKGAAVQGWRIELFSGQLQKTDRAPGQVVGPVRSALLSRWLRRGNSPQEDSPLILRRICTGLISRLHEKPPPTSASTLALAQGPGRGGHCVSDSQAGSSTPWVILLGVSAARTPGERWCVCVCVCWGGGAAEKREREVLDKAD